MFRRLCLHNLGREAGASEAVRPQAGAWGRGLTLNY